MRSPYMCWPLDARAAMPLGMYRAAQPYRALLVLGSAALWATHTTETLFWFLRYLNLVRLYTEWKATGCSPSLYSYNNTAPVALTHASVSTTKLRDRLGNHNTGGLHKSYHS